MSAGLLKSSVVNKLQVYGDLNIKQTKKLVLTYNHLDSHPPYQALPPESLNVQENTTGGPPAIMVIDESTIEVTFVDVISQDQLHYQASGTHHISEEPISSAVLQKDDHTVTVRAHRLHGHRGTKLHQ